MNLPSDFTLKVGYPLIHSPNNNEGVFLLSNTIKANFEYGLCAVCHKQPTTHFCDYVTEYNNNIFFVRNRIEFNEINQKGKHYNTCDLPLCEKCRKEISHEVDFCPHHYILYKQSELPDMYQRKRQSEIRGLIANIELNI